MSKVRLIDANALGRYLNDCAFAEYAGVGYEREYETMCRVLKCIENAPTVDAVKHGRWIEVDEEITEYKCSECGVFQYGNFSEIFSGGFHFCPHCGAKMDRKRSET